MALSTKGLMHLLVVYVVWSSTYLAIRVAVAPGSGFPPFLMGGTRMVLAGLILLALAAIGGHRLKITKDEFIRTAIAGVLLWVGGNGLVTWAEQSANSGFACLMVSSSPIWVAFLNSVRVRRLPSLLLIVSLLLGFAGIGVLMAPAIMSGNAAELSAGIALTLAAVSWAAGSVYQTRHPVNLSAPVAAAYQHLISSVGFFLLALLLQEPVPQPTISAWAAWSYLVIFGSVVAFTSFVYSLRLLPINIAMTYAYVNPVLALFLGAWLLAEPITSWTLAGAAMVIVSVFGIFRDRFRHEQKRAALDDARLVASPGTER